MLFLFRIGSKPVLVTILFIMVVFFSACSDRSENELAVFKALDESLINSNLTINKATETQLSILYGKTTEAGSAFKANIWYPKAMIVKEKSANIISYLEELKKTLKKEAGLNDTNNSFSAEDKDAVKLLFKTKGTDLYERLKQYRRNVLAIDSEITTVFSDKIILTTQSFDTLKNEQQNIAKAFFNDIPTVAALTILSQFQNNVKVAENRIVQFCNNKVGSFIDYYTTYSAIVAQSSTYVRAGEEIEITAGIGSFSRAARPEITVNKRNIEIDESGVAVYKFNASTKAGKHIVPISINFTDQDGKKQLITKDVEYTVINKQKG